MIDWLILDADSPSIDVDLDVGNEQEVVDAANERTRQVEDLRKIQQIKKLLGEELCSQYVHHGREVILGCPALVLPKGRNTPQQRFLVLLSDMVCAYVRRRRRSPGLEDTC